MIWLAFLLIVNLAFVGLYVAGDAFGLFTGGINMMAVGMVIIAMMVRARVA
jgi:hypothetical protein